ncbi:MAG TPA: bacterial transcriptional activator domain-containing protein [Actinocatenispora sp.]
MAPLPGSARSAYLRQVQRIAPPQLVDRDAELTELAAFCVDEDRGPWVWWQAGAWAGKSALVSSFVLHPPQYLADRVSLVSFFITARLAAQDTEQVLAAARLYRADLLADGDDGDWAAPTRADLRARLCQALRSCSDAHLPEHPDRAASLLQQLLAIDPLHDATWRRLLRLQTSAGQHDRIPHTLARMRAHYTAAGLPLSDDLADLAERVERNASP